MGAIGRPHGVRGWVRVQSYTADPAQLARLGPLAAADGRRFSLTWRAEGIAEIAEIVDGQAVPVADRTAAGRLANLRLYADRDRLPPPATDEFYLADLVGMQAVDEAGRALGTVGHVADHGGGAFLEIGPLLVPFSRAAVPAVDLAAGRMTVSLPIEVAGGEVAGEEEA
jgi:16S rRNA processing protein RimM